MNKVVLELRAVSLAFNQGRQKLEVLQGVNLQVSEGETVALVGPSGAGKSTLLHIAGLLEAPDSGDVVIFGQVASSLDDDGRTRLRRDNIGFVYQFHHLLPEFNALENVVIPQTIAGFKKRVSETRARELLGMLGLCGRVSHRPGKLSGGEQQRVAIARALANAPRLLLADEPTGNLDPHTAGEVFDLLLRIARAAGLAAVVATHNPELAKRMDRTVHLTDGHLEVLK